MNTIGQERLKEKGMNFRRRLFLINGKRWKVLCLMIRRFISLIFLSSIEFKTHNKRQIAESCEVDRLTLFCIAMCR